MTAADLKRLPRAELDALWSRLRADRLPVGTYDGISWPTLPWRLGGRLWNGKVFLSCGHNCEYHGTVWNRIGPVLAIQGDVVLKARGEVVIDYPQLHLQDRLKPVNETLWLGRMKLLGGEIWFSLEETKS